jgi:cytochrome oxidase Cu insertion factor (SCO1/SenC/PrrC family)
MSWLTGTRTTPELTSSEMHRQTAARLADKKRAWTGLSGDTLTGAEIAQHLDAARTYLTEHGWRTRGGAPHDEVPLALFATAQAGEGDDDTHTASIRILDLIVAVRAGVPRAEFRAWEGRRGRTWTEVATLLRDAAQFAREHGPTGGDR